MLQRGVFPPDNTLQFPNDLCYSFHSFVDNECVCIRKTCLFNVTIEKRFINKYYDCVANDIVKRLYSFFFFSFFGIHSDFIVEMTEIVDLVNISFGNI